MFVGATKEFCCINTNKIFLLIRKNCFLSVILGDILKTSQMRLTKKFVQARLVSLLEN